MRDSGLGREINIPRPTGDKMTKNELEARRTKCEVYSRVVGYIRPVQQWNDGKQAEYADRKEFVVSDSCGC